MAVFVELNGKLILTDSVSCGYEFFFVSDFKITRVVCGQIKS